MLPRQTRAFRSSLKWGGLVLSLPFVLIWLGTAYRLLVLTIPVQSGTRTIAVDAILGFGGYCLQWDTWDRSSLAGLRVSDWDDYGYTWFYAGISIGRSGFIAIPTWAPPALSLSLAAWAWRAERRERRAQLQGPTCPNCGCSRLGLTSGAPCPECAVATDSPGPTCPHCAHNLKGLPRGSPCPECGKAQVARASRP